MTTKTGRSQQTALRMPHDLLARVDAYAERMRSKTPGIEFSRADAMRVLVTYALDDMEMKLKLHDKKK